ncbi:MAG: flagellar basal body rod protein FlgC [Actinomycetota bacterium]|jgi:flagellar basal-body rod protein FlgC|nr:flagellar basal body rod protein FlgC [Actinomycetota bacterium]
MGAFGIIDVARSGVSAANTWLGAISHNLANANTATSTDQEPFRAQRVVFRAQAEQGGTRVSEVVRNEGETRLAFDPDHPLANENGIVQLAQVDVATEMTDMIVASRHYQMNLRVVSAAEEAYKAALQIGRG